MRLCLYPLSEPSAEPSLPTTRSSFRFHAPTAKSAKTVGLAQRFMYAKYPGWVRGWIAAKGGMTRRLITMDYTYASNFIKQC